MTDLETDDTLTICAISVLAAMLADVLHEGVGHAALALVTGAPSGVLTTVAWSSTFDSKLVAAGGTLVNLVAAGAFWFGLRAARGASVQTRYFLLISSIFNLFDGTGYFFFSGVSNFGDWAQVIAGLHPYWLWRTGLIAIGIASYYGAVLLLGIGLVRYFGVPLKDSRVSKLTILPYISAVAVIGISGLLNPLGLQLVWQSALPATAGAYSGFLWFRYYIPRSVIAERPAAIIERSYAWIALAATSSLVFIFVLGRGITLSQ
jgi:hypothetical protein